MFISSGILPLGRFLTSNLLQCLVFEITVQNKRGYFNALYRSPTQIYDTFRFFMKDLKKLPSSLSQKAPNLL